VKVKRINMKVTVKYSSGLMLVIPKTGNAPMLFMEWISSYRGSSGIIHKIINDTDGVELGYFKVRLNAIRETYFDIAEYINLNL
jgi:hypothetical protein